ncbi:hypothetical protein LCER1_G007982 [Lachnellula cervina]|uniref:Retroviral polymerase SH3-like domain-containing protein n=1 Tax=Lachnellula cervina TaxID=1316786 RepID=A0A7D8YHV7_9HELO|nr:hypothetical protein LCER1_G007982 [Lachnellula cervina]
MIKTQFPKAQIKALKLDNAKEFKSNKTPFKALTDKKPNIGYIKILGLLVYTLVLKETRKYGKLSKKGNKGILIGFESANNFLVYLPIKNKVISTKNLIIKEDLVYTNEYNKSDNNNYLELLELSYSEDNTNLGGAKTSDPPSSSNNNYNNSPSNSNDQEDHNIPMHNNLSNYNKLSLDHY